MAESKEIPSQYDLDAKWDAYLDLGVRRFVYSSATGVLAGLLLFRKFFEQSQFLQNRFCLFFVISIDSLRCSLQLFVNFWFTL